MNYTDTLRERLFHQSELFLTNSQDWSNYERLIGRLFVNLNLSELDRNTILISAYDFLKNEGADNRTIALTLSLLDGGLAIVKTTETFRDKIVTELQGDIDSFKSDEDPDEEAIDDFETTITQLQDQNFHEVHRILTEKYDLENGSKRTVTPFESAFIRNEFREHRRCKKGNPWKRFKRKLSTMFGLSEQQIASIKAWESDSLKQKGGNTIEELLTEIKERVARNSKPPSSKAKKQPQTEKKEDTPPNLNAIYQDFSEEDLAHIKSVEPDSFILDNGKIAPTQRHWIFAVMILTLDANKKELRKKLAEEVFRCSVPKVAAVTAYLTGKCRDRASQVIKDDIAITESFLDQKKKTPTH